MGKSVLYNIFSDLVEAMKDIVPANLIFLKDRPSFKKGDVPMGVFMVIDLPTNISDYVLGNQKTLLNTSGVIYIFTQARSNSTLDVNVTGDCVDKVCEKFPIGGVCCVAKNPRILLRGNDGYGFQSTTITFDLRSRWRAFE